MFELFNVGLEMQKRMIDLQMQGIEVAQQMVDARSAMWTPGPPPGGRAKRV